MGYDLIALRIPPGESADNVLRAAERRAAGNPRPVDEDEWQRIRGIADALQRAVPGMERWEDRAAGIVEVSTGRLQASVGCDDASVSIPYWTLGTGSDGIDRAGLLAAALAEAGGFTVWDPQADEVIRPDDAVAQVTDGYRRMAPAALRALGTPPAKPWWKFW